MEKDIYQVALLLAKLKKNQTGKKIKIKKMMFFFKSECADHDGSESIVIEKETTVTVSIPTCKTQTHSACAICVSGWGINVLEESRLEISFLVCVFI